MRSLKTLDILAALAVVLTAIGPLDRAAFAAGGEPMVETITLAPGQSKVITAPWPTAGISVTEPSVADLKSISPTQILLIGKTVGSTDVQMWNQQNQVQRVKVQVTSVDLESVNAEAAQAVSRWDAGACAIGPRGGRDGHAGPRRAGRATAPLL